MDLLSDQAIEAEKTLQLEKRKCAWDYIQKSMPKLAALLRGLKAVGFQPSIPPESINALAEIATSADGTTAR